MLGAIEYLEWVGKKSFGQDVRSACPYRAGAACDLKQAMRAIRAYEFELSRLLLDVLEETPGVTIYGLTDRRRLERARAHGALHSEGTATHANWPKRLGDEGIYVWDGNYYAIAVTERLGIEDSGGMLRVGPVHYNTVEEINKLGEVLGRIRAGVN